MRAAPALPRVIVLPTALVVALAVIGGTPAAPAAADLTGVTPASVTTGASSAASTVAPHPVDPTVTSLPLTGVDRATAAAAANGVPSHGAPGAAQTLATKDAAILTAPTGTKDFQTVGVTWRPTDTPPDLVIAIRTRESGRWTAWTALDSDDDDGSEDPVMATGLTAKQAAAKGLRAGTPSLWTGPSDGVQVRVVVRSGALPKDLQLELIDPGTSMADAAPVADPAGPATGAGLAGPATGAAGPAAVGAASSVGIASMSEPQIYSRASWGANESKVRHAPTYMSTIKGAVLHHTAGPNKYAKAQVPGIIRGDYAYHLKRGWSDIGYNALVDRFGRIWEGRAGGIDKAVMGAHAGGFNAYTFGVSVIGNYDTARPTSSAVEAVARVIAWKLDVNHRSPLATTSLTSAGGGTARYRAGRTVTLPVVMGHRNTGYTACPGRYLYPYLPHIRARIKTLMKAALTNPSASPGSTTLGTPLWISARSLAAQSWQLRVTSECSGATVATLSGRARAGQSFRATWDGTLADGSLAPPGAYTLQLTSRSRTGVARPVSRTVLITPPVVPDAPSAAPSTGAGGYTPVTPARLVDADGRPTLTAWPQGRVAVPVLGRAGVPASGVTSVVLNVTVTCASSGTSLEVWPTGGTRTKRAVTSVPAGRSRSVLVTSQVGADGSVSIINGTGVAQLTVDVVGYYSASGQKVAAVPTTRILDTTSTTPLGAGESRSVSLPASIGGVPAANITAVVADLSAVTPAGDGTLTAFATGAGPLPASLVFEARRSTDNLAIIPVTGGAFMLRTAGGAAHVTVDVRGVVTGDGTGSSLTAITPAPVLTSAVTAGTPRSFAVTGGSTGVPAGATAVLIGLNAAAPTASGSFELYPSGTAPGPGAAMRVMRGDSRGTVMLVPVGSDGKVAVKLGAGSSKVTVDVRGYLS